MKRNCIAVAILLVCGGLATSAAAQTVYTWNTTTTGLDWSTAGNWTPSGPAAGSDNTADFSQLAPTSDMTVHLDAPQTIGNIIFGDTGASASGWTLDNNGNGANILTLDGAAPTITVNALGAGKVATISAVIGGSSGMTKAGAGDLVLTANNAYTGGTTVSAGTLELASAIGYGTLGLSNAGGWTITGTMKVDSGVCQYFPNAGVTLYGGTLTGVGVGAYGYGQYVVDNPGVTIHQVGAGTSTINAAGGVTIAGAGALTFNVDNGGEILVSSVINGGGGGVTETGAGLLLLTGANTYTGPTTISGGTLQLGDGSAGDDGSLATSSISNSGAIVYNLNGNQTAAYAISGSGSLTKTGSGALVLTGINNTYTGGTTVSGGTLELASTNGLNTLGNYTAGAWTITGTMQVDSGVCQYFPNAGVTLYGGTLTGVGVGAYGFGQYVVDNPGVTIHQVGAGTSTINAAGGVTMAGAGRSRSTLTMAERFWSRPSLTAAGA